MRKGKERKRGERKEGEEKRDREGRERKERERAGRELFANPKTGKTREKGRNLYNIYSRSAAERSGAQLNYAVKSQNGIMESEYCHYSLSGSCSRAVPLLYAISTAIVVCFLFTESSESAAKVNTNSNTKYSYSEKVSARQAERRRELPTLKSET